MTTRSGSAASGLDQLTITIVVDNATDTLSSIGAGIPQLPEMVYLLGNVPPSGQQDGHNCVVTHAEVHDVGDLFLASGDIPRRTTYETGLAGHHSWYGDQVALDPEIHDERLLAATVRGRGTTVLTACSHAASSTSVSKPGDSSPINRSTSYSAATTSLAQPSRTASNRPCATSPTSSPRIVAPGHCTGWRAAAALVDAFSPTGCASSVVGTRYLLNAS